VRGGYLTLGRWRGAPVRAHWTLPVGALVFGQGRFVPGFWLGFFLLVLVHELGHAVLVRRYRQRVVSIDVHGLGGVCRWSGATIESGTLEGFPSPPAMVRGEQSSPAHHASAIERAKIAWGGVLAQAVALVGAHVALAFAGPPESAFAAQLAAVFTTTNLWMIAINLIPMPPLDGAEAWKLLGLWAQRQSAGVVPGPARGGFEVERKMATLDRFSGEPDEAMKAAVDDTLARLRDQKTPGN